MPDTTLITSKQQVRIAELVAVTARNVTYGVLEQSTLDNETAQNSIITKGGELQALLFEGFASVISSAINKMSGRKHQQAELIEQYFAKVLGYTLDLSGIVFPEKEGFVTYMAVPSDLTEDQIFSCITTHFKEEQYSYQSPVASNIKREVEQKRPQGLYVFSHLGDDEPDAKHLGKSYDDAMAVNMTFMNTKEYLLVTGFHCWLKDHFMDVKGWTHISSLWSGGHLVNGCWRPGRGGLYLTGSDRDDRLSCDGPRELFLG